MWQAQIDEFGGPEVLHPVEVADPEPGPGQVLIRAAASGITFVETQVRAGRQPWPGPGPALPAVLGNGVAGWIVAAGPGAGHPGTGNAGTGNAGTGNPATTSPASGTLVVTATGGLGGYADHVVVGIDDPVDVPDGLTPGAALAILADGRTALALVRAAAISPGDTVLVTAAAGGVGTLLVQLARQAGARRVIAAAGGGAKLALARELGADLVTDYTRAEWAARVRDAVSGLDVAFDGVGGPVGLAMARLMLPGGRYLAYGAASGAPADPGAVAEHGAVLIQGQGLVRSPADNRALVTRGLAQAAAGRLRTVVGQEFPLSAAADAHAAIEARATTGKTVLIP